MVWCGLKTRADIAKVLCEVFPVTHFVALVKELRLTGAPFPRLKLGYNVTSQSRGEMLSLFPNYYAICGLK